MGSGDRPAAGFDGAQLGDVSMGDVAGGDIYQYQGARADSLVELLRYQIDKDSQYRLLDLNARELRQKQTDHQNAVFRAELRVQRVLLILILVLVLLEMVLR